MVENVGRYTAVCQQCCRCITLNSSLLSNDVSSVGVRNLPKILNQVNEDDSSTSPTKAQRRQSFLSTTRRLLSRSNSFSSQLSNYNQLRSVLFVRASPVVDHPMCADCSSKVAKKLNAQIDEIQVQLAVYRSHQESAAREPDEEYRAEINALVGEISELEQAIVSKEQLYLDLEREQMLLEIIDSECTRRGNHLEFDNMIMKDSLFASQARLRLILCDELQFDEGLETDIFDHVFHIDVDDVFGSIDSLRLGRSDDVSWDEVNAAWGQATRLLIQTALRLHLTYAHWQPVARGSLSFMKRISDGSIFNLNGSSEFSLGALFWYRNFDTAQLAFLDCVHQCMGAIHAVDPKFVFPCHIVAGQIGLLGDGEDMITVKYQWSKKDVWTRAMKYMLSNMKVIVSWLHKSELKGNDAE